MVEATLTRLLWGSLMNPDQQTGRRPDSEPLTDAVPSTGAERLTETTRYLCEGVYLDRRLRDAVIHTVYGDPLHRVPPSYGFDIVPVVEHAWRALALETCLRVCVVAVFTISFTSNPAAGVLLVSCIGLWHLIPRVLRSAVAVVRVKSGAAVDRLMRRSGGDDDAEREEVRRLLLTAGAGGALVAAPVAVSNAEHIPLADLAPATGLLLSLIAVVPAGVGVFRQLALVRVYHATCLRPARRSRRLRAIDEQQHHPCVVYRHHGTKPFMGSGIRLYAWNPLVVPLLRQSEESIAQREHEKPPFNVSQLMAHLKATLAVVGDPNDPTRLLGFTMRDRLFISEAALVTQRDCLVTELDVVRSMDDPHGIAQHYLEICVTDRRGLVVTVFVRATIGGRALSMDFSACALTAIPPQYYRLDEPFATGASGIVLAALRGLGGLPQDVGNLWRLLQLPILAVKAACAQKDWTLVPLPGIRIGSRRGIREIISLPWEYAHMEKGIVTRLIKQLEQRVLAAVEEFLERLEIDTSQFKDRVTSIINTGIINFAELQLHQSPVGTNAKVESTTTTAGSDGTATTGGT